MAQIQDTEKLISISDLGKKAGAFKLNPMLRALRAADPPACASAEERGRFYFPCLFIFWVIHLVL